MRIWTMVVAAAAITLPAMPVAAQYSEIGAANLDAAASLAGTVAVNSHLTPDEGGGKRTASTQRSRTRQTCRNARRMARGGDKRPEMGKLLALCRQVGM